MSPQQRRKSYEERLEGCTHPLLRKLFKIIIEKKSNLCVAANFDSLEEVIKYVDRVGEHICMLKTQTSGMNEHPQEIMKALYEKKRQYNFLLFEDPKWCDGTEPVRKAYSKNFVKYADLVTVMSGESRFKAIELAVEEAKLPDDEPRGCLVVGDVSYEGCHIMTDDYKKIVPTTADENSHVCVGIIAQDLRVKNPCATVKLSPGVNLGKSTDGRGQRWNPPSSVVGRGADVVIVGRGITSASLDELDKVTQHYKEVSYQAYLDDLQIK